MLVSLSWLRDFVPYEGTIEKLSDRLTMLGLEIEGVSAPFASLEPIVVGHVIACSRHPEADKLSVCRVDVGSEVLDIVCGAPNVAQGQKVAVVRAGSALPDGTMIKASQLRGQPSNGMICSEAELGLSDEADGIMVLDDSFAVGTRLVDALELNDSVLDVSITPNRGDCLSILGVAREVAMAFKLPLTMPKVNLKEYGADISAELPIAIDNPTTCYLYQGRVIENVSTAPSPFWLRRRLLALGVRSISNIVDVTNYILMELGHPLHAFDLDALCGNKIRVALATAGESFVTLDGQTRELSADDITICDAGRVVGLAGVMGGLNSEITGKSTRVFLECAVFAPLFIRRTARRLGLHSEASYRFERGVDQGNTTYVLDRAAELIAAVSDGSVRTGIAQAVAAPWEAPVLKLRRSRAEALIGVEFSPEFCVDTLTRLGCSLEEPQLAQEAVDSPEVWNVVPPSHRLDVTREVDLIEELVRVYGVDNVPAVVPAAVTPLDRAEKKEPLHIFRSRVKHWASGIGLNEAINYSFVSHDELDFLGLERDNRISIINPLSDAQNVLRPMIVPGLLHNLRTNISQGAQGMRLFEVAAAFTADASSPTTAKEIAKLGILLYGSRFDDGWPQVQADFDYQDIKGIIENLLVHFYLPSAQFELVEPSHWLAPHVNVSIEGTSVGYIGKVKSQQADQYHAKKSVWVAELDLDLLYELYHAVQPMFSVLPVYPPVRRDITFIASPQVRVAALEDAVRSAGAAHLEDVRLIDLFEPHVGAERHLTVRLTFRHENRTLKDGEVDKQRDIVVASVSKQLQVRV